MTNEEINELQAKLDAMTALELSEYINERQRRERARNATQDRNIAQDVLLERQG
jgi:hypothetical protein